MSDQLFEPNIADQVEARARECPWAVACIDAGRPISFRQFDAAVHRAAARLRASGVGPGTVIGTTLGQSALHLVVVLAAARLGAASVALRPPIGGERRAAVARRYGVQLVVREANLPSTDAGGELLVDASLLEPAAGVVERVESAAAAGRPWRYALSSGTTGVPKAVAISHRSLDTSAWLYRSVPSAAGGRRHLLFLDLNAPVSINMALRRLIAGDPVILVPGVSPETFFDAVDRHGVDASRVSPQMLGLLADHAPGDALRCSGLEIVVTGGALPAALRERAARRITDRLVVSYGSTETGTLAIAPASVRAERPDAAGRLVPWVQAQAVDDEDRPLPLGERGRLRFRGPEVIQAYVDDDEANARSFRDGWFYPGDLGAISPDGMLLVSGRTDDMLDVGGRKVNAVEVDAALMEHPDVAEAASFVVLTPTGRPLLMAAVVSRGAFDERSLLEHCRSRLGTSAPNRAIAVPALPRSSTGKVQRRRLVAGVRIGGQQQ